jgi:hypothetical protein
MVVAMNEGMVDSTDVEVHEAVAEYLTYLQGVKDKADDER